jgi:hypothetical protein
MRRIGWQSDRGSLGVERKHSRRGENRIVSLGAAICGRAWQGFEGSFRKGDTRESICMQLSMRKAMLDLNKITHPSERYTYPSGWL